MKFLEGDDDNHKKTNVNPADTVYDANGTAGGSIRLGTAAEYGPVGHANSGTGCGYDSQDFGQRRIARLTGL